MDDPSSEATSGYLGNVYEQNFCHNVHRHVDVRRYELEREWSNGVSTKTICHILHTSTAALSAERPDHVWLPFHDPDLVLIPVHVLGRHPLGALPPPSDQCPCSVPVYSASLAVNRRPLLGLV